MGDSNAVSYNKIIYLIKLKGLGFLRTFKITSVSLFLSMFIIFNTGCNNISSPYKDQTDINDSYSYYSKDFISVDIEEIESLQKNNTLFYLYTGRETCPYCLEFVIGLDRIKDYIDTPIYYLDSVDSYDNSSEELKSFRDKYSMEIIPSLILFNGSDVIANLSDYLFEHTDDEVINFFELYKNYELLH